MVLPNLESKAPAKRSQHFNPTYRNIVGRNMLHAFGHPVATCCDMLRHVGCCWLKFETGQIFHATFVDVAWCCSRSARFVQQCCTRACALVRFSIPNMSQHVATEWPNACNMLRLTMLRYVVLKCWDRLAGACKCWANNVATCCVDMLRLFGRGLKLCIFCKTTMMWTNSYGDWYHKHYKTRTVWRKFVFYDFNLIAPSSFSCT